MTIDTTGPAVERLAASLDRAMLYDGGGETSDLPEEAAATLRALAAERDEARNGAVAASECAGRMMEERDAALSENDAIKVDLAACLNDRDAMEADRDAARAEARRLRELLARAQEELRLINMKDTGALYDIGLRSAMNAALADPQP